MHDRPVRAEHRHLRHHFIGIDFGSFGNMVDAVGGVDVCVPEDIVDREHQIFVPKGDPSTRPATRPGLRAGALRRRGDPAERHLPHPPASRSFIGALVRQVKSAGTLTRSTRS